MKNIISILLVSVLLISCKQKITNEDIVKLNGYWEINKVELPDGNNKDYKVNETIDYFSLSDTLNFRKKVMPQFDGTFLTNDKSESFTLDNKTGKYIIHYKTQYSKWDEEIIALTDSVLVVKNEQKIKYHYKRFQPFSLK